MQISYSVQRKSPAPEVKELISLDRLEGVYPEFTPHTHSETYEMIICLKGEVELKLNGSKERIAAGCYQIIPPGTTHTFSVKKKSAITLLCAFTCLDSAEMEMITKASMHLSNSVRGSLVRLEREMTMLLQQCSDSDTGENMYVEVSGSVFGAEQLICSILTEVLILALREQGVKRKEESPEKERHVSNDALIDQIESYIAQHAMETVSVQKLAEYFHYSRTRLSVIYRQRTGNTLQNRIANEKMKLVLWELEQGMLDPADAAKRAGFQSQKAFERKFRKVTGEPGEIFFGKKR